MSDAIEKANRFLANERQFRLGALLTESLHPKTRDLSSTAAYDLPAAVRMLQSVDEEIPPALKRIFAEDVFEELIDTLVRAMRRKKRIFFTGCGATGRLSILLEAAWRCFWTQNPQIAAQMQQMQQLAGSVMAGGDLALIKSVEDFEDFPAFGRYHLSQAGVGAGDVVVAITEGGETPFVIGTAWQGLDAGAEVFFVYNNPTDTLRRHVRRSREIIDEPRIRKLDLTTGPMAISGSTRMQATTAELVVVAAALEIALVRFLREHPGAGLPSECLLAERPAGYYHDSFVALLAELSAPLSVDALARAALFEERIYREHGLVTYAADSAVLDVLTDTTERSPTFMLPPFRKHDDRSSPVPWAFVKDPLRPTPMAWHRMLGREPRGLDWGRDVYQQLGAPAALQAEPPCLDNTEIYRFLIGNEPDRSRTDAPDSALVAVCVGEQTGPLLDTALGQLARDYRKKAVMSIGPACPTGIDEAFEFRCELPASPLRLWEHVAAKLVFNTLSTATMARMGRVIGNAMVWVSPSNKKLIDRGCRLISQQCRCSYERACIELYKAIEQVESFGRQGREVPSPVALAIERISKGRRDG